MTNLSFYYELTPFQYDQLVTVSKSIHPLFAVVEALDTDEPPVAERFRKENKDVDDLISLGFVTDVTSEFRDSIHRVAKEQTRRFRIFLLTQPALSMFYEYDSHKTTIH